MTPNTRILIVDDDSEVRQTYQEILSPAPTDDILAKVAGLFDGPAQQPVSAAKTRYPVTLAANGAEGIDAVERAMERRQPFAAAFIDMKMPGIDGAETSKRIWAIDADIKIVIVTGYSEHTPDDIVRLTGRDDLFYLRKPFNREEIRQFARALTSQWNLEHEKAGLLADLHAANAQLTAKTAELGDALEQAENANLRFEDAGLARTRFLSLMNHELRTPLNGILGFTDLLRGQFFGPLNDKQVDYVNQIDDSGKHLLSLISDILDVAKIDAGELELETAEISAQDVIHAVTTIMDRQFTEKNIAYTTFLEPDLPLMTADRRKCQQILLNLLSNAVKYTPEGGRVEIRAARDGDSRIRIEVGDTGAGIAEDDIDHIFSRFHQADYVFDEQLGGAGIGLALTRRLVEMHGGEIGVASEVGTGSTFWFTLPAQEPPQPAASESVENSAPAPPERRAHRILVAEDNEINLALLLDMLSIQGHDVVVARNGLEAVELTQSHKPELILMDIRMPVMGGLEATQRLRGMPEFADLPIIALTASTGSESEDRQITAGCTEHLSKPIQTKELFAALAKYVARKENV